MVDTEKHTVGLYQALVLGGYEPGAIIKTEGLSKRELHNQTKVVEGKMKDDIPKATDGSLLQIQQLNDNGIAVETWTLHGAFIKSTNFGQLDYASDELVKLELVISYDYVTIEV